MPGFQYEAMNQKGEIITGFFAVETVAEVEARLAQSGLSPLKIQISSNQDGPVNLNIPTLMERLHGIKIDDLILFCRQLSTMLAAGIVILQALRIIGRQAQNVLLRIAALDIADQVEGGTKLSDAFAVHHKVFTPLFYNMVRVGEETGSLDRSFDYLSKLNENEKKIYSLIKPAPSIPAYS